MTFWHRFGTLLEPSWDRFGFDFERFLGTNIDVNSDSTKMRKGEPPSRRELKNQGLEGIEKASKIDVKATSQACWQKIQKICPKVSQNGPKTDPRGPRNEVKIQLQLQKHLNKFHLEASKNDTQIDRNFIGNQILRPSTAEGKSRVLGGPGSSQQRPISSQQRQIADQLWYMCISWLYICVSDNW